MGEHFVQTDCAFYKFGTCTSLNKLYCRMDTCRFYKTAKRLRKEQDAAREREKKRA